MWEIHDDNGVIFKGKQRQMVYAWDINYLADWAFEELYGHTNRDPKWIIKVWHGSLKLVQVIERTNDPQGKNKTWLPTEPS